MTDPMTIWQSFWAAVKEWGNTVPDCPSCGGTGEAYRSKSSDDVVYWKGQLVRVCGQCKGAGKV